MELAELLEEIRTTLEHVKENEWYELALVEGMIDIDRAYAKYTNQPHIFPESNE
jgi:hypothetical protein